MGNCKVKKFSKDGTILQIIEDFAYKLLLGYQISAEQNLNRRTHMRKLYKPILSG